MLKNIHIGTSGWSYKHWKEIFYPKELKPTEWLTYFANTFSVTEINASFYRLPLKQTVEGWLNKVPDNFLFCPKINRYLTHIKRLKEPEEPLERFFNVFEPMKNRMGPVLVQLPPTLKFDYGVADNFYTVLKKHYGAYRFAMEVRHETWLAEDSLTLMAKYDIAFVISQSGKGFPYAETVTATDIYVRFHGPAELYSSCYSNEELQAFASLFKKWHKQKHKVWAFFNNDVHGYALQNGRTLAAMLS